MAFYDSYIKKAKQYRVSKGKSGYDPALKAAKDYYKYGHEKTAFTASKNYQTHYSSAVKQSRTRNVVKEQHKKPQVARNPVSAALDVVSSLGTGTLSGINAFLKGERNFGKIFNAAKNGFFYQMPGRHGDKSLVAHGSNVYDSYQDFMHNLGHRTLNDIELESTGDVKVTRDKFGKVHVKSTHPDTNYKDDPMYKFNRGFNGFLMDTVLDPLNLVGGEGFKAAGKILHGSGATTSRLERLTRSLQTKNTRETLNKLWKMPDDIRKSVIANGVSEKNVYSALRPMKRYNGVSDEDLRVHAKDVADTFNSLYQHIPTLSRDTEDITLGIGHHSFATKRMATLNKKIVSDNKLRKIGDYTVAPYWNEFTQRLTTSRLGKALTTHSKMVNKIRSSFSEDAVRFAILDDFLSKESLAMQNNKVYEQAEEFKKLYKQLSPADQLDVLFCLDEGTYANAGDYFKIKNRVKNEFGNEIPFDDSVDLTKTKNQLAKKYREYKDVKQKIIDVDNKFSMVDSVVDKDMANFTPEMYMYRTIFGETPNLASNEDDVMNLVQLMVNDDKIMHVNIQATMLDEIGNMINKIKKYREYKNVHIIPQHGADISFPSYNVIDATNKTNPFYVDTTKENIPSDLLSNGGYIDSTNPKIKPLSKRKNSTDIFNPLYIDATGYSADNYIGKVNEFDLTKPKETDFADFGPIFESEKEYKDTLNAATLLQKQLEMGKSTGSLLRTYNNIFGTKKLFNLLKDSSHTDFASFPDWVTYNDPNYNLNILQNKYGNGVINPIVKYAINNDNVMFRALQYYQEKFPTDPFKITSLVEEKAGSALNAGNTVDKIDATKKALDDTSDEIKSALVSLYSKTNKGYIDVTNSTRGSTIFDEYHILKDKIKKQKREKYIQKITNEHTSLFDKILQLKNTSVFDDLDDVQKMNLRAISLIESVINPHTKAHSFSDSIMDALDTIEDIESYEKKFNKYRLSAKKYNFDPNGVKYQISNKFNEAMERIADSELQINALRKEQVKRNKGKYVPRILTDEARARMNQDKVFKSNGNYSGVFGKVSGFNKSRTSHQTMRQMYFGDNQHFNFTEKDIANNKRDFIFKTDLPEVFVGRSLINNRLIYSDEATNYLFNKFSLPVEIGQYFKDSEINAKIGKETDITNYLKANHTLCMPYNRINDIINARVNKMIESDADNAASNFMVNLEQYRDTVGQAEALYDDININSLLAELSYGINYSSRQLTLANKQLKELTEYFDKNPDELKHPYDEVVNKFKQMFINIREQAKINRNISDDDVKKFFNLYKNAYDKREKSLLHGNEKYAQLHEILNDIEEIKDEINTGDSTIKKMIQGAANHPLVTTRLFDSDVKNTYKNAWMGVHKNDLFDKYKNDILDDIFGKVDDADKSIRQRRATFAPNIPVQRLTAEQIEKLDKIYFKKNKRSKYKNVYQELRQFDNQVMDMVNVMSKAQEMVGKDGLARFYDNYLMLKYKQFNTVIQPAFHVQNALGNAYQTFLGTSASALKPSNIKAAHNILSGSSPERVITLGGKEYKYRELLEYAKRMGVIDESFTRFDLAKGNNSEVVDSIFTNPALKKFRNITTPFSKNTTTWQKLNSVNPLSRQDLLAQVGDVIGSNIETTQRMNLFLASLDEGMGMREAVKNVNDYMFDYSDLTDFEEKWLKNLIPFYTYMRKNIPMELKKMFTEPQKFTPFANLYHEATENMDDPTDNSWRNPWRQNYIGIPNTNMGVDLKLPYEQLDRLNFVTMNKDGEIVPSLMSNGEPKALGMFLGSTNPFIKSIIELSTGVNQYVDMPIYENGSPSKEDFIKYLMQQTIPGNIASDVRDIEDIEPNYSKHKSEKLEEIEADKKRKNEITKLISSNIGLPVANIYNFGDFKNNTIVGKNNIGLPYSYKSYLSQDEVNQLYDDTYGKFKKEKDESDTYKRNSAYEAYTKYLKDTGQPVPSFEEFQEKTYHVAPEDYNDYAIWMFKHGYIPEKYEEWRKEHIKKRIKQ